jgi:hypothetical protein
MKRSIELYRAFKKVRKRYATSRIYQEIKGVYFLLLVVTPTRRGLR